MPQRISRNEEITVMSAFLKVVLSLVVVVAAFVGGYFTANKGYRVVDPNGSSIVKSNAAQIVKEENAKLSRDVINLNEQAAKELLAKYNRTMFVGIRDGVQQNYVGQKTFTNLTVEVKNDIVIRVLGWY